MTTIKIKNRIISGDGYSAFVSIIVLAMLCSVFAITLSVAKLMNKTINSNNFFLLTIITSVSFLLLVDYLLRKYYTYHPTAIQSTDMIPTVKIYDRGGNLI